MLDVYINSPGYNEHRVVDGWSGLLDLLLLADSVGNEGITVFTVRHNDTGLAGCIRQWRGAAGAGYIACDYLAGHGDFTDNIKDAGYRMCNDRAFGTYCDA